MDLLAHSGDAGLFLLVPGVVFSLVYRLARGQVPTGAKRSG